MVRAAGLKDRAIEKALIAKGGAIHASSSLGEHVVSFDQVHEWYTRNNTLLFSTSLLVSSAVSRSSQPPL
jgi:hypothetical protein